MAEDNDKTPSTTSVDPELAQLIAQAGGMASGVEEGFGKDFTYPVRQIRGVVPELSAIAQMDIRRGMPADRNAYGGHLLVNEKGFVARQPYDPDKDARRELMGLKDDVARASLLNLLYSRGFYDQGRKPSQGAMLGTRYEYEDLSAMSALLYTANARGTTWQPLQAQIAVMPTVAVGSSGNRVRVTSSEDLGVYLREESFRQLGRNLTKQELQQAIIGIQNQQRQRAGSSMDAPNISVAAEQAVAGVDPDRRSAMKLGQALQVLFSGGGG